MTGSDPKAIRARERLIFALDVPGVEEAWRLVERLGDAVSFYKVGLELAMTGGAFELVDRLVARGSKVFLDLKLFDIPETVARAVERLAGRGVTFTTVHGNQRMMEAAARAARRVRSRAPSGDEAPHLKVLAVTVLTSLDQGDLDDLGFETDVRSLVLSRARRALEAGCDGVVTSGLEAEAIRDEVGERLLVVMPGIRPVWNDRESAAADDQKRTVDVAEAFRRGADYIVVGRPIRNAPDPRAAAEAIQGQIGAAVGST